MSGADVSGSSSSRIVYYGQWAAALIIPFFYVIGRVWLGTGGGWFLVFGVVFGPLMLVLLLVPPPVTFLDRETRQRRATTGPYTGLTFLLWGLGALMIVTRSDQADGDKEDSALSAWTGLSIATTDVINVIVTVAFWLVYLAVPMAAIRGHRASRQAARAAD